MTDFEKWAETMKGQVLMSREAAKLAWDASQERFVGRIYGLEAEVRRLKNELDAAVEHAGRLIDQRSGLRDELARLKDWYTMAGETVKALQDRLSAIESSVGGWDKDQPKGPTAGTASSIPNPALFQPPLDNDHVAPGCELFPEDVSTITKVERARIVMKLRGLIDGWPDYDARPDLRKHLLRPIERGE